MASLSPSQAECAPFAVDLPKLDSRSRGEITATAKRPDGTCTDPQRCRYSLMDLPNEIIYKIVDEYVLLVDIHPPLFCWPENGIYRGEYPVKCPYDEEMLEDMEGDTNAFVAVEWMYLAKDVRYSVYQWNDSCSLRRTPAIKIGFDGALCPVGLDDEWKNAWERLTLGRSNRFLKMTVWERFDKLLEARNVEWRTEQNLQSVGGREWLCRALLPPPTWDEVLRDKVLGERVTAKELAENLRESLKNRSLGLSKI